VDNFVGKSLLTAGNARFYAGFNKLLISNAKYMSIKIKDLQNDLNTEK
jgi:hypothetical protein